MEKTKDQQACFSYLHNLHSLAKDIPGKLVLSSFGENSETGNKLTPINLHFEIGDVEGMYNAAQRLNKEEHRNVYTALVIMRPDLPENQKGDKKDAVAILGLNADFDDGSGNWVERCPIEPNFVMETSPGNYQCVIFFDKPLSVEQADMYAKGLQKKTGCDSCSGNPIQVWRIPGLNNWPNKKKVENGRDKLPFTVVEVKPWYGELTRKAALFILLDSNKENKKNLKEPLLCPDISKLPINVQELIREGDAEGKYTSRSEAVCAAVGLLYRHNFGADEITSIIHANAIGDRFNGNYKRIQTDVRRVIDKGDNFRVFSPSAPLVIAETLVKDLFMQNGTKTLHHYKGEFFSYNGRHYEAVSREDMAAMLWKYLANSKQYVETKKKKGYVDFNPKTALVNDTLNALAAHVNLPAPPDKEAPFWLKESEIDPAKVLACQNGIFDLSTDKLHEHTPDFFNFNCTDVAYDPKAQCPEWLKFLDVAFMNDPETIATMQEIFGYALSPETNQQKIFLWIGPSRSGKGTCSGILTALRGHANVAAPTLSGLAGEFGLWPLIGKPLAIIGDARTVKNASGQLAVERLLGVSGEDHQSINRKQSSFWNGKLPTRFIILSNLKLQLPDASAVIVSRLIAIQFRTSFLGKEDIGLKARLNQELPGILNWAVKGYRRLSKRGHFIQPKTSRALIQDMEALSSPVSSFCSEACYLDPEAKVLVSELFEAYQMYQARNDFRRDDINVFGRDLTAIYPHIQKKQLRRGKKRHYFYVGIGLNSDWMNNDFDKNESPMDKVNRIFG